MSLLVLAGVMGGVAAAGLVAFGLQRALRRRPAALPPPSHEPKALPAPTPPAPCLDAFGVNLGDVIMLRRTEAWVTGVVLCRDGGEHEVGLFFTDERPDGDMLMIRPPPRKALFLVHPIQLPDAALAPHTLEHDRELFTRKRKIPVAIEQYGRGCPAVGDTPTFAWFESPGGDVLVCLQWTAGSLSWRGREIDEGSAMRLAAGKATFRDE